MELWDAYDSKLNKIDGMTLIRGEEVPNGFFHLVSEIIVDLIDKVRARQYPVKIKFGLEVCFAEH